MRQSSLRDALRAAWYGTATVAVIATRHRLNIRRVNRFWQSEKAAGRLPNSPRPHFIDSAPRAVQAAIHGIADAFDDDFADDGDDTPIGGPMGLRIPDPDPLLIALKKHHAADCWRHLDGMPATVLHAEAKGNVPSRRRVREFAQIRDGIVSALMRMRDAARSQVRKEKRCPALA